VETLTYINLIRILPWSNKVLADRQRNTAPNCWHKDQSQRYDGKTRGTSKISFLCDFWFFCDFL